MHSVPRLGLSKNARCLKGAGEKSVRWLPNSPRCVIAWVLLDARSLTEVNAGAVDRTPILKVKNGVGCEGMAILIADALPRMKAVLFAGDGSRTHLLPI